MDARKRDTFTRNEMHKILQNINDALYINYVGDDMQPGRFIEVNPAACEQLGYSQKELLALDPASIIPTVSSEEIEGFMAALFKNGRMSSELTVVTKNRNHLPVEINSQLVLLEGQQRYIVSTVRAIEVRKRTEMLLERMTNHLNSLFKYNPDIIFSLNKEGRFTNINPAGEKLLEYTLEETKQLSYLDTVVPSESVNAGYHFRQILDGNIAAFESKIQTKSGKLIDTDVTSVPIIIDGQIEGVIGIARDITLQKRTQDLLVESEQRYKSLFEHNIDAVLTFDLEGNFQWVNEATEKLTGYPSEELLNLPFLPMIAPEEHKRTLNEFQMALKGKPRQYETVMINKEGSRVDLHVTVIPIYINDEMTGIHCIGKDITEKKQAHRQINYMAYHDYLTGLKNQRAFQNDLLQAISEDGSGVVLFLDLDRFKSINDSLGHDIGDLLLEKVSKRLSDCVDETNVYRFGGDEFMILLPRADETEGIRQAKKIINQISEPYDLDGFEAIITASVGISLYPEHGDDTNTLIKKADNAMYHAKRSGRNNYQVYDSQIPGLSSISTLKTEVLLRKSLMEEEFELHFQPQLDLRTNTITGAEALIRWDSKELGMIPPNEFIPIAEETGLIVPIGEWVLRTACRQNAEWLVQGLPPMTVSVNLSMLQFYQTDLISMVASVLEETGLPPDLLELEITESMAIDGETATIILRELKKLGVKIAIDDFGTGYSSLSYLKDFPIDHLKIDHSFIKDIASDDNDRNIVASIISLGHNLNLGIIAEGVETAQQLEYLREHGCDTLQGYLFSKPVKAEKLPEVVEYLNVSISQTFSM